MSRLPIKFMLRAGQAECELWPDFGGSIAHWSINGQNMFRTASNDAANQPLPLNMASFPLVPYSNRIGFGRFEWDGLPIQLELNFPPEAHALHGTGWMAQWNVVSQSADAAVLCHNHKADKHWPWNFEAEQHIQLTEYGLTIHMVARNLSDQAAPLAFGHHPYFDCHGATLTFGADTVWRTGKDGLPDYTEAPLGNFDFTNGRPVDGHTLDNGYAGWDGHANIRWGDRPLQLYIRSDMHAAVVYIPNDKGYFCFEPVPHINNALNLPAHSPSMPVIGPAASFNSSIKFQASATRRT